MPEVGHVISIRVPYKTFTIPTTIPEPTSSILYNCPIPTLLASFVRHYCYHSLETSVLEITYVRGTNGVTRSKSTPLRPQRLEAKSRTNTNHTTIRRAFSAFRRAIGPAGSITIKSIHDDVTRIIIKLIITRRAPGRRPTPIRRRAGCAATDLAHLRKWRSALLRCTGHTEEYAVGVMQLSDLLLHYVL